MKSVESIVSHIRVFGQDKVRKIRKGIDRRKFMLIEQSERRKAIKAKRQQWKNQIQMQSPTDVSINPLWHPGRFQRRFDPSKLPSRNLAIRLVMENTEHAAVRVQPAERRSMERLLIARVFSRDHSPR